LYKIELTLLIKVWNGNKSDEELKNCIEALENYVEDPENKAQIIESFNS
jgi:hypothetical protein